MPEEVNRKVGGDSRRAGNTGFEGKEGRTKRGPERVLNDNHGACLRPCPEAFHLAKLCLRP